jgi:hypothetical protein
MITADIFSINGCSIPAQDKKEKTEFFISDFYRQMKIYKTNFSSDGSLSCIITK